jgi:glycine/serine hydroxymethyltransferase
MKEEEMSIIAKVFTQTITNFKDEEKLKELKQEILNLCKKFPIYK